MQTNPSSGPENQTGPEYWRSLDELADTPEFKQWLSREFPQGAGELTDPVSRRHFVKIMSASFLMMMGLTGCRRPEQRIVPFSKMPDNYKHGIPEMYATAMPLRETAVPLLVRSDDGHPTKVEGNPEHPASNGGTDSFAQASVLGLYDPDRAIHYRRRDGDGEGTAAKKVEKSVALKELDRIAGQAEENGGQGLCFLMEESGSPSRERIQAQIRKKWPKARWFSYEPIDFGRDREAASKVFARSVKPDYQFEKAKVILSLDADCLGTEEDSYIHIKRFAQGRKIAEPGDSMSRLYAIEGLLTLTGSNADHRLRVPTSQVQRLAADLAQKIGVGSDVPGALAEAASDLGESEHADWVSECANDLMAHRGEAVVVAGYRQPIAVHLLAHAMNMALGNVGKTVLYYEREPSQDEGIEALAEALNAGEVKDLVIMGGNPAYNAPADLDWEATQEKADNVVRLGYYNDETSAISDWLFPRLHYLESWGDARTREGTMVSVQPLLAPLFGGMSDLEFLARVGGLSETDPHQIVRQTFEGIAGKGEDKWQAFLHDGYAPATTPEPVSVEFDWKAVTKELKTASSIAKPTADNLEVVFHRDASLDDGRFNNNGWLQEFPDPITKITWENVIMISRKTAKELGVDYKNDEDLNLMVPRVKVTLNGRTVEGPLWIQPGMADNTLALAVGYGRSRTGRVGDGAGYNAYQIRAHDAPYIASGATLEGADGRQEIACTQGHWSMEGRPVIREANLEQFNQQPDFAKRMSLPLPGDAEQLYPNPLQSRQQSQVHQWGMSIDLNSCVGCSACVLACQSENNVPIVGKEQVTYSREMHWLRIDRYFSGNPEDPQVVTQPMLCQHCESAPCENVCPVNATVHDDEGLNLMIYNRCVGTRYCSNNCPYKVRRFNFFDYNRRPIGKLYQDPITSTTRGEWELKRWFQNPSKGSQPEDEWELVKMVKNPDVTVRMRGVMEKCTFCVQRIEQAKIDQKVEAGASDDVEVPDGAIKPACQQACPADAIVFGNLKDPNSRVSQLKEQQRDYQVLEYLGTHPRTTYLAKVRNPNPAMPGNYTDSPATMDEFTERMDQHPLQSHSGHGSENGQFETEHHSEKGSH